MAEYIEREVAIEAVKKERYYTGKFTFEEEHGWAVGFQQGITFAISDIAAIPAADVRPVVTCGECKHWFENGSDYCSCDRDALLRERDFFCAAGEKREES